MLSRMQHSVLRLPQLATRARQEAQVGVISSQACWPHDAGARGVASAGKAQGSCLESAGNAMQVQWVERPALAHSLEERPQVVDAVKVQPGFMCLSCLLKAKQIDSHSMCWQ